MTKQEIALKHGFIQGLSIHSSTAKIEECLYEAMEEYAQQQVKLFATPDISNSVCFVPDNVECRFRNKKGECTSFGDCLKADDC